MQKIYLKYPEITQLKANIVSRRVQNGTSQIILDRTIFMPKTTGYLEDEGFISDLEIISVEEKRNNIIHTVKGKPNNSEVLLKLSPKNRMANLYSNTAFIIFSLVFESFYKAKDLKLSIEDDRAIIKISDFFDRLDYDLLQRQINFIISKNLSIENKQGISSIYPLGELINNEICLDSTAKLKAFKIKSSETFGNDLEIEFIAGDDILL